MNSEPRRALYSLMGKPTIGCILGLVLLSLTCPTRLDAKNQVGIEYGEASSRELIDVQKLLIKERFLETVAKSVESNSLQLPSNFTFKTAQCGAINAFYTRNTRTITLCYEMIHFIIKQAEKDFNKPHHLEGMKSSIGGAVGFLFLHEFGHAIIDLYNLHVTGREEDVADQFAIYDTFEAAKNKPEMEKMIVFGALWFLLRNDEGELSDQAFRNEHSLGKQRYYNIMCWAYGKNSIQYGGLKEYLQDRAPRCKDEYEQGLAGLRALVQSAIAQGSFAGGAPFQLVLNQVYSHPNYPMLVFGFSDNMFLAMDKRDTSFPIAMLDISSLPEGQWLPVASLNQQQLPVMVMRRGNSLIAKWVP